MLPSPLDALLVLLLTLLFFGLLVELAQFDHPPAPPKAARRGQRPLRPRMPDDCAVCRAGAAASAPTAVQAPISYSLLKSSRGRKKSVNTAGYVCPNPDCRYHNNPDPAVHALVGYGHPGRLDPIQDFYCQACHHTFSARRHTALYGLRTPAARVAQVVLIGMAKPCDQDIVTQPVLVADAFTDDQSNVKGTTA